jgi:hypothetical protein
MNTAKAVEYIIGRKIAGPMDDVQLTCIGGVAVITTWDADALGVPKPTQEELEAAYIASAVTDYIDKRRKLYAPIGDQLDMQYHDRVNNTTTWLDHIAYVKSECPK